MLLWITATLSPLSFFYTVTVVENSDPRYSKSSQVLEGKLR
jgi:hypothetical protein